MEKIVVLTNKFMLGHLKIIVQTTTTFKNLNSSLF